MLHYILSNPLKSNSVDFIDFITTPTRALEEEKNFMQKHFGLIQTMKWLSQVNGKERQTLFVNSDSEYGSFVKDIS